MLVDNGDAAEHGTDNTEKALVGAGKKKVVVADIAILDLVGTTINRAFFFCSKAFYRQGCKSIFIYNMLCEITNDFLDGRLRLAGDVDFGSVVSGFVPGKGLPAAVIGEMGGADLKMWLGGKALEICRKTDDAACKVNQ